MRALRDLRLTTKRRKELDRLAYQALERRARDAEAQVRRLDGQLERTQDGWRKTNAETIRVMNQRDALLAPLREWEKAYWRGADDNAGPEFLAVRAAYTKIKAEEARR